jgi:hypothetical protein
MDKTKKFLVFALIITGFILGLIFIVYKINFNKNGSNLTASINSLGEKMSCNGTSYNTKTKECCEYKNVSPEYFSSIYHIKSDLSIGSSGLDVTELQSFLLSKGFLVMPAGTTLGYFGPVTQTALARYQAANNITLANGKFDQVTRNKIVEDRKSYIYQNYKILDIGQCEIGGGKISSNNSDFRKAGSTIYEWGNLFKYHCPKKFSITLTGEECDELLGNIQGGTLNCENPDNPLMNPPELLPGHIGLSICLDSKDYISQGKCFIPPWTANNPFVFYGNPDVDESGQITGCGFYAGIGGRW